LLLNRLPVSTSATASLGPAYFSAPGITGIIEDGDEIEIDYTKGVARNLRSGKEVSLRRFPPTVEKIYASGGIQKVIAERLAAEGILPPADATALCPECLNA
jgi:dihydroxyacid dehydratase/phosphogluconate dehydratase